MDYLTTNEIAEKWGISSRWVTELCNEGRIKGAAQMGRTWIIPKNAEKPEELKRGKKPERGIK